MEDQLLGIGVVIALLLGGIAIGDSFVNAPLHDRSLVSWHDADADARDQATAYLFRRQFTRPPSATELATYVDCINGRANSMGVEGTRTSVRTAFKGCRPPE